MGRFLIELEHPATKEACERAIEILLSSGSHFLTNAEWGCEDDTHKCWIMVDIDSKEEARSILPPLYRNEAKIIQLNRYTIDSMKTAIVTEQY